MGSTLYAIAPLPPSSHAYPVDTFTEAASLEAELRRVVTGEVRFDRGTRAIYSTDSSNYRQFPIGVVLPRTREDVINAVAVCRRFRAPLLSRGAGTSLAGQCCNVAVVLDFSKYMNGVLEIDPVERWVRVEPGIVLDTLQVQVKPHGLFFAPDPATHSHCTLGGMLGNNSCGSHALYGGKTDDNTLELEVLLYDGTILTVGPTSEEELQAIIAEGGRRGEIYAGLRQLRDEYAGLVRERFPDIPRRVSGYNLDDLLPENGFHVARALVGSEATCVVVLSAKLRLMQNPSCRTLVVAGYRDMFDAADAVPSILEHKPIALEGVDRTLIRQMQKKSMLAENIALLPGGNGWLYVEFGADCAEASHQQARDFIASLPPDVQSKLLFETADQKKLWEVREAGLGATAITPGEMNRSEGWEDHAVAPEQLGSYLRGFQKLLDEFGYSTAYYGHFGQACVHVRINFDLRSAPGIRHFRAFIDRAADLVVAHGGSLSGEHGDGQARGVLLERMYGPELIHAFERFKDLWDPAGMMNPGKLIRARQPHADLRFGADYAPARPKTHFAFGKDEGLFSQAVERCVGVGKCRKEDAGTMCPSYMATRDEQHSTRGRAHALWEMLQGEAIGQRPAGASVAEADAAMWNDHHVKETLDLCLSCKACKSECPVSVDMSTYKAEFMSHFYEHNRRPLHAYAFGYIDRFAQVAAVVSPELLNLCLKVPGVAATGKLLLGVAQERTIPEFAPVSFTAGLRGVPPKKADARAKVVLWPDTFNNYFDPQAASAAKAVLERAGFRVHVPREHVCCGRPLYDFGFLEEAKRYMLRNVERIGAAIDVGLPVIVLEPSCASVFRDDAPDLLPGNARVQRLAKQTFLLSEFLEQFAPDWTPPQWPVEAVVQGHCHHKALMKMRGEEAMLRRMGAKVAVLDSGCCGMAGPFGFEADKIEVSQALANRVLVPAVQTAPAHAAILADGFSCREAVKQNSHREGIHLAELLELAHRADRDSASPEVLARAPLYAARRQVRTRIVLTGLALAAGFVAAVALRRSRR